MKRFYLLIVFFVFFGINSFADTEELEEIGYLLFMPNSSNNFFEEDQAMIQLDNLAAYLKNRNLSSGQILVVGYTASVKNGVEPINLSINRALFVIDELHKRGIPKNLISPPVGYGETSMWGDNTGEGDMCPNRRVRIMLDTQPEILITAAPAINIEISAYDNYYAAGNRNADESRRKSLCILLFIFLLILLLAVIFFLLSRKKRNSVNNTEQSSFYVNKPIAAAGVSGSADSIHSSGDWHKNQETSSTKRSNFMEMEKVVKEIISSIPSNAFFDVHTIVEKLLQEHDDVYLTSIGHYTTAAHYHSKISAIIAENTDLVEKAGNSYSKNIHDKFSECHLFKRK